MSSKKSYSLSVIKSISKSSSKYSKKSYNSDIKILLICHSRKGTTNTRHNFHNIYKELNIPSGLDDNIFDTNDIFGTDDRDIKYDLSKEYIDSKILTDKFNKFNKYDIIYLVNCPSSIYIKEDNLNINLFRNLNNLLKSKGVIITRFSDIAISEMLGNEIPHFDREVAKIIFDSMSSTQDITIKTKKVIDVYNIILKNRLDNINDVRNKINNLLDSENDLNLKLLNTKYNKIYINSERRLNIYDYLFDIRFYFVFKKKKEIIGGSKNNKYKFFKSKDNKIIRKKIFIINNKEKVLLGKKRNGEPKYVSFKTFNKFIN